MHFPVFTIYFLFAKINSFFLYFSENPRFVEAVRELEASPVCQSLKMQSFLMLPMQRITRLPLLIDAIFTRLDSNSSEFEVCREALEIINKVKHSFEKEKKEKKRLFFVKT